MSHVIENPQENIKVKISPVKTITSSDPDSESVVGLGDKHFTHTQVSASSSWTVTHNLDKFPSVTVIDSGNNKVIGDIHYIDQDTLTISFTAAFSGVAYLN